MTMAIKPPSVNDDDKAAASALLALLTLNPVEARSALEKICAAARAWAESQFK